MERVLIKKHKRINKGGRPKGSRNAVSAKMRALAAESGELPNEFMLRVMRTPVGEVLGEMVNGELVPGEIVKNDKGKTIKGHVVRWVDRMWAAQQAGPYYAPRLQATKMDARVETHHVFSIDPTKLDSLTPTQLLVLEEALQAMGMQTEQLEDVKLLPPPDSKAYEESL